MAFPPDMSMDSNNDFKPFFTKFAKSKPKTNTNTAEINLGA